MTTAAPKESAEPAGIPIVMAAFGTARRAMETYAFIDGLIRERFPDHPLHWAYSSRVVRDLRRSAGGPPVLHPDEVLAELARTGHTWAVVQSLHLMCGHEFQRLTDMAERAPLRTSVGLPLLHCPRDYEDVMRVLARDFPHEPGEALVLVGHGTDHPSWCSYVALDHLFRRGGAAGVYVGVVEQGYPTMDSVIRDVKRAGFRRVRLVPFLLVAGMHFEEDMSGDDPSWKTAFEGAGITVSLEDRGMGFHRGIIDIFSRHVREALEVIPGDKEGRAWRP